MRGSALGVKRVAENYAEIKLLTAAKLIDASSAEEEKKMASYEGELTLYAIIENVVSVSSRMTLEIAADALLSHHQKLCRK